MRSLPVGAVRKSVLGGLAALALASQSACVTNAEAPPLNDPPGAVVTFPSGDGTTLRGIFARPEGAEPVAAVVMMHGCSGMSEKSGRLRPRERWWFGHLLDQGHAVLLVDGFGSRGHGSICGKRARPILPERERPHDAYGALRWLQARPGIRGDRVALMGWSHGAMAALWTIKRGAPQRPGDLAHDFRAAAVYYPGCFKLKKQGGYRHDTPLLMLLGGADDWTAAKHCLTLRDQIVAAGGGDKLDVKVYEGAHHAFDHPNLPVRSREMRNSAVKGGGRTVHVGTHPEARLASIADVDGYLAARLGR